MPLHYLQKQNRLIYTDAIDPTSDSVDYCCCVYCCAFSALTLLLVHRQHWLVGTVG